MLPRNPLLVTFKNGHTSEQTFQKLPPLLWAPVIVWAEDPDGAYREFGYSEDVETDKIDLGKHAQRLHYLTNLVLSHRIPIAVFVPESGFLVHRHELYLNPKGLECGEQLSLQAVGSLYPSIQSARSIRDALKMLDQIELDRDMIYMFGKPPADTEYDLFVKRILKHYSTDLGKVDLAALGRDLREFYEKQQKQLEEWNTEITKKTDIY